MSSITNIVVVMLENRSYDNVLGWLYGAGNAAPYDQAPPGQASLNGLTGSESNTDPTTGQTFTVENAVPSQVAGHGQTYPATSVPMSDPNEPFGDMAQQYLGVAPAAATPWKGYQSGSAPMSGFVENYAAVPNLSADNLGNVMTYLTPAQLPVTAFLANQFAVSDEWFASVPSQTFVNRLFALCASPQVIEEKDRKGKYSVVDDADHPLDLFTLTPASSVIELPSILEQLDGPDPAGPPRWKIYFHDYSIALMTVPYAANAGRASTAQQNVSTFDRSDWGEEAPLQLTGSPLRTFVDDVQNESLPPFAFIEPRYNKGLATIPILQRAPNEIYPPNSNHPGAENSTFSSLFTKEPPQVDPSNPPIDCNGGELLLMQVYNLLRNSSYWPSTLLVITYDEAGGVYDHAAPPASPTVAVPAVQSPTVGDTAAVNFDFNAYGGRVPAIVVSPFIAQGTALTGVYDHASIVRTVRDAFKPGDGSLTARDAAAQSVLSALDFSVTNDAPAFSGTIVASPSAVIVDCNRLDMQTATLLASAGPNIELAATTTDEWISIQPIAGGIFAPDVYGWTLSFDEFGLGDYTPGSVTIASTNVETPTVTVDVSLYLKLL